MKSKAKNKLLAGFILSFVLLGGVGWMNWQHTAEMRDAAKWVNHTERVLDALDRVLMQMQDIETGGRGFVITGDPTFLQPLNASVNKVNDQLRELHTLVSDNPQRLVDCDELEPLVAQRIALAKRHVELRRNSGFEVARQEVAHGEGKAAMDKIRETVGRIEGKERALLVQRANIARNKAHTAQILTIVGIGVSFVLLAVVFTILLHQNRLRQQAQAVVEKSAAEIHDLYNNAPCGYHAVDRDGVFLSINDTELNWRGYKRDELVGKRKHRDLVSPETRAAYDKGFAFFKEHGEVKDLEFQLVRKDGSVMDVLLNATAMRGPDGQIHHSRSTMFDITERKKAESERDRFFLLSLDMLCIAGMDGYFKRLNPAFSQTLGYTIDELLARPFLDFVHPDDRALTISEVEKLSQGVPTIQLENRYQCKDGTYKWLSWKCQPYPSEGLLYATGRDVTERKEVEEKIEKLNNDLQKRATELQTANKELEAFSYSVSHDLRAPLRHIAGFVNLLKDDLGESVSPKSRRFLKIIGDSSKQMGQLIDELLVFSQMGRVELQETIVDANQLVEEAIAALQPEIEGKNIVWKKESLPELRADPALLRQIFINLISNAVKYSSPRNPAQIEIGHRAAPDENIIFIRDNGVGFDMQFSNKLFGVFQRLHQNDEFEGTGIGLANVRRIIQRHGGRTWAEGIVDQGATFYFSLPKSVKN